MFGFGPATRIYVATGVTDMRKSFNGLYGLVRDTLGCDPTSGHVFLFTNARRNRLKLLVYDGSGLWVAAKKLDGGRFRWPESDTTATKIVLSQEELALLVGGIEITRATMCGWVMTVGEMLLPVVGAMRKELLASGYIQADETPVDVQTHDKRGKNHQAYLWQYGTPGGSVVFDFRMNRGREGPKQFLGAFAGILQTDDYVAYERGLGGEGMVHACCWSHARRHFVDAVKLNKQDAGSIRAVELMGNLFSIDAEAREEKMDHAARHLLRQEKAPPVLNEIREHIVATRQAVLPGSTAGQACKYTLTLWEKLTRFLDLPRLELSNNLAENSMRPVALGRSNWIHIGSSQAGPRVAAILSVIESCRRLRVPVRDYLTDILPGLADMPIQRVAALTPTAWAAKTHA